MGSPLAGEQLFGRHAECNALRRLSGDHYAREWHRPAPRIQCLAWRNAAARQQRGEHDLGDGNRRSRPRPLQRTAAAMALGGDRPGQQQAQKKLPISPPRCAAYHATARAEHQVVPDERQSARELCLEDRCRQLLRAYDEERDECAEDAEYRARRAVAIDDRMPEQAGLGYAFTRSNMAKSF